MFYGTQPRPKGPPLCGGRPLLARLLGRSTKRHGLDTVTRTDLRGTGTKSTPHSGHQASASRSQQADIGGAGLSGKIKQSRRRPLRHRTQRDCAGSEARHLGAVSKDRSPPVRGRRPHAGDPRLRSSHHLRAGNSPCRSSALGLTNENGNAWHETLGLRALCVEYACTFLCSGD